MPRTARNIVEFDVHGLTLRAVFNHEHAEEHPFEQVCLPVFEEIAVDGGLLGSQSYEKIHIRDDWDAKITKPIIEELTGADGKRIVRKLRHVTTCSLYAVEGTAIGAQLVLKGEGKSRCSVRDKYNWRKGIKDSLKAAIKAAGIEREGPVLASYYAELPKRPTPPSVEGVEGDVHIVIN